MKFAHRPTRSGTAWLLLLWGATTVHVPIAGAADPTDFLETFLVSDGNPATDDRGRANIHINAVPFKSQALTTVADYQFTSYYDPLGKLVVARRNLHDDIATWDLLRTEFTSYNINDAHNTSSIGIDGDGFLHVSWGMHGGGPLLYTRSTTPVLNDGPLTLHGQQIGNAGMLANQIPLQNATNSITYPEFWNIPGSGDLLFTYRTGRSGNGEYQLARWDNDTDTWLGVHTALNSPDSSTEQPWIDNDFSGDNLPNANAYPNGLAFDATGRLHVTWTWRTGGDSTSGFGDYQSNHNIMYAYSDDQGVTWHRPGGTLYQRNGVHDIDESSAPPMILIAPGSSLINTTSTTTGPANNHVYLASAWAPEAIHGDHLRQIMLLEYDGTSWDVHQVGQRDSEFGNNRIPESQLRDYPLRRPVVLADEEDRVFLVFGDYQRGGGVSLAYSEKASRDDWTFIDLTTENLGTWSPVVDRKRWENDGILSVYLQPTGMGQIASPISVLEWDARAYFSSMPASLPGDYNGDGVVNLTDYLVWRDSLGQSVDSGAAADGNSDGQITHADYAVWKSMFGGARISAHGDAALIPEPRSMATAVLGIVATLLVRRRATAQARRKMMEWS